MVPPDSWPDTFACGLKPTASSGKFFSSSGESLQCHYATAVIFVFQAMICRYCVGVRPKSSCNDEHGPYAKKIGCPWNGRILEWHHDGFTATTDGKLYVFGGWDGCEWEYNIFVWDELKEKWPPLNMFHRFDGTEQGILIQSLLFQMNPKQQYPAHFPNYLSTYRNVLCSRWKQNIILVSDSFIATSKSNL